MGYKSQYVMKKPDLEKEPKKAMWPVSMSKWHWIEVHRDQASYLAKVIVSLKLVLRNDFKLFGG